MTLKQKSEGIYLDDSFNNLEIDSLIFDCDGVLIDITKSYDSNNYYNYKIYFRNFYNNY